MTQTVRVDRRVREGGGAQSGRSVLAISAAVVVTALLAASACAPSSGEALGGGLAARWPMDERAGATVMADVSGSGFDGVIGAGVAVGDGTYRFPGWTGNVDAAGRLTGRVPATSGAASVPDPWGALEPGRGSFVVSLRLRSALTGQGRLPTAPAASFNVVQKGRADQAGGFWKLELSADGSSTGRLRWVISDGASSAIVTSAIRVDDGRWHTVVAERRGDRVALTVDGVSTAVPAGAVRDVRPGAVPMTIGKKPGSTDPRDAFAGWLDDLAVGDLVPGPDVLSADDDGA
jgi:hypothetical protein